MGKTSQKRHIVSKALIFILITMLAAQSLGMSPNMVPDKNSENTTRAMPCHEQAIDQSSFAQHSKQKGAMDNCCGQANCDCSWGCSGLLNVQVSISPSPPPFNVLLREHPEMPLSTIQSLYRPPIFA